MSTPYRAIECDRGGWHSCQDPDCDWAGEYGGEDHCERTGHRVRAGSWKYYEKHCEVEAYPIGGQEALTPPGIEGAALFFELTDYEDGDDWFEILEKPDWEAIRQAASRMMSTTEDTHHCFLEGVFRVKRAEVVEIRSRAIEAGFCPGGLPVYRLSMGS